MGQAGAGLVLLGGQEATLCSTGLGVGLSTPWQGRGAGYKAVRVRGPQGDGERVRALHKQEAFRGAGCAGALVSGRGRG